jgi:uncharacterized protein with FMN-binding domain
MAKKEVSPAPASVVPVVPTPPTSKPSTGETPSPTPIVLTTPAAAPAIPMKKKYVDGQYTAEGSYVLPNNEVEKITVSVTLLNGIITTVDYKGNPIEQGSIFNQKKFSEGYKALVVGKNIDEVNLTVVNGSSLTSLGFMEALKSIKVKAQTSA